MSRWTGLFAVASLIVLGNLPVYGVELAEAIKNLPPSANSLAIVKIQGLTNSTRGKQEGWAKKHQTEFLAGSVHIPPTVDFVVRAFEFHPEDTRVSQSYGVAAWQKPVAMSRLAEHEKHRIEMIEGHAAVRTDRNTYFAEFAPGLVGGMNPGYRQDLARWLRSVDKGTVGGLSPYLTEIANSAGSAQVVLALDFEDLIDPKSWRERIKTSTAVADKPNAVTLMTKLGDSLRGVSLKISVTDKIVATMGLDFGTVVSQTAQPFLKPVVLDLLSEAGAMLDDLTEGEVMVHDKSATITFALSDSGLRQVMSMVLMPGLSSDGAEEVAAAGPNAAKSGTSDASGSNLRASQIYFTAINQILDDLDKQASKGANYNRTAVFHDTFAKKIDQLSIRGVDPDLVQYGQKVSANLRALAVSLRGVPLEVNRLQGAVTYNFTYQPAGFYNSNWSIWSSVAYQPAYANVETNQAQIRAEQAQAIANGAKQREEVWQIIAADRQAIRVKMLDKFGRDFETPAK